jgi:hypothetical protein
LEKEVIFAEDMERIFGPRAGAKAEETPAQEEPQTEAAPAAVETDE